MGVSCSAVYGSRDCAVRGLEPLLTDEPTPTAQSPSGHRAHDVHGGHVVECDPEGEPTDEIAHNCSNGGSAEHKADRWSGDHRGTGAVMTVTAHLTVQHAESTNVCPR